MALYSANPPTADLGTGTGPLSIGVEFTATAPASLVALRFYAASQAYVAVPLSAALYPAAGGSAAAALTPVASRIAGAGVGASSAVSANTGDKATDGSTSTQWTANVPTAAAPQTLHIALGGDDSARTVTQYSILPHTTLSYAPATWTFEGSWTGVEGDWTVLDTRTSVAWGSSAAQTFTVANPGLFRVYRWRFTANNGSTQYISIREVGLTDATGTIPLSTLGQTHAWRTLELATPYELTPGTRYRAVIYFPVRRPTENSKFPTTDLVNGPLTVYGSANSSPSNQSYTAQSGIVNPTSSISNNYMVDVVITDDAPGTLAAAATLTVTTATTGALTYPQVARATLTVTTEASGALTYHGAPVTASATLTVTTDVTGALVYDGPVELAAASATLTVTTDVTGALTYPTPDGPPAAVLTVTTNVTGTLGAFTATTSATMTVTTDVTGWLARTWTRDPITGRGAYQLAVTDRAGTVLAQLATSYLSRPIVDRLNDVDGSGSGTAFEVPDSATDAHVALRQYRELTVARGGHHLGTYVLLNPEDQGTAGSVPWQAAGLGHYFTKRRIGPARRQSLLTGAWRGGYRAGSIPAQAPKWSRVAEPAQVGPSLRVEGSTHVQQTVTRLGSDTTFAPGSWDLSSAGQDAIRAFAEEVEVDTNATDLVDIAPPTITIEGHTDDVPDYGEGGNQGLSERRAKAVHDYLLPLVPEGTTLRWVGYGETRPIVPNRPGGTAENRRVDIIYPKMVSARGHRQYVEDRITYTNPSRHITRNLTFVSWWWLETYKEPNADASVIWVGRRPIGGNDDSWVEFDTQEIDAETPLGTWTRSEASITVPADGQAWEVVARLTPPAGTIIYDEGATHLWADDALEFIDVDQADIVKALVAHAQDPAFDKDDLGITVRATRTGIKRKRVYYWHDRQTIAECLEELLSLSDGLEVTWETTPTSRTLVTHYPRAGKVSDAVLHGYDDEARTVDDYRVSLNGQASATTVIIQADGSGADREEGVHSGVPADLGLVLEEVYTAEPGTHIGELNAQAKRGHKHYAGHVPIISATVRQELTDEWLDKAELGDVIGTDLPARVKHVTGPHRVTARSLDPVSDRVVYSPTVEV